MCIICIIIIIFIWGMIILCIDNSEMNEYYIYGGARNKKKVYIKKNKKRVDAKLMAGSIDEAAPIELMPLNKYLNELKINRKKASEHIELELRLLNKELVNRVIQWVRMHKPIITNTVNRIWTTPEHSIIETNTNGRIEYSIKERLTTFMLYEDGRIYENPPTMERPFLKCGIAAEYACGDVATEQAKKSPPTLIRRKYRISARLNDHWMIDCTYVNNGDMPEVEFEYLGDDYWKAPIYIKDVYAYLKNI